jgi:serine/threonine-protein kinase
VTGDRLNVARVRERSSHADAEAVAYLQQRVRLFFCVLAWTAGFLFVATRLMDLVLNEWDPAHLHLTHVPVHLHFWTIVFAVVLYVLLGRRRFSHAALRGLDGFALYMSIGVCVAFASFGDEDQGDQRFSLMLIGLFIVTRALIVPSTGRWTFWLSLPALPIVLAVALVYGEAVLFTGTDIAEGHFEAQATLLVIFLAVCSGIAAFASKVNFTLRRRARQAEQLGQYVLEELIGEGSMGSVYRATHALLKRPTAIKLLRPEITGEHALKRFEQEVRQTSRLTHPNTISVFDYGHTADGIFYYAMELLDGADLDTIVRKSGAMPPARVIHVLLQACGALEEAHDVGLIHRDIKPGNIILCRRGRERDVVKLLDFGLVKELGTQSPQLTQTGTFVGSPITAAPEAFVTESVTPESDLYSLGVVGYYVATGHWPFHAATAMEFISQHIHAKPIPSAEHGDALPRDLEDVLMRCMEKEPADRPSEAGELRDQLAACADAGQWTRADAQAWWETFTSPESA